MAAVIGLSLKGQISMAYLDRVRQVLPRHRIPHLKIRTP